MQEWISATVTKADVPAWLQAFAALVALFISVWGVWRTGSVERRRDKLEALGIAVAIYPEIEKLQVSLDDRRQRLQRIRETAANLAGQSVGAQITSTRIEIPLMLERNFDRLFLLGPRAGPICLQTVNVLSQYNSFVDAVAQRTMMLGPKEFAQGLDQLDQHLTFLSDVLIKCESAVKPMHDAIKS